MHAYNDGDEMIKPIAVPSDQHRQMPGSVAVLCELWLLQNPPFQIQGVYDSLASDKDTCYSQSSWDKVNVVLKL